MLPGTRDSNIAYATYANIMPALAAFDDHVACFWQDGKGLWWSRFDGKEWTEAELVDGRGTVPLAEQGFRGQGSVVAVGKNELFVTATNVAGVLRWDGKTWHKENIPGAVDAGCLTVCGDTVMLVTAGRDEPGWHGIQWTRTAKVLCYRRDPRTGKWDKPLQLSKGEVELYIYRAIPALSVPRYSPPNFAPVAWTGSDRKTIYIVKVPARRRSPPWRTLRITYLHTRSVMAARELKGGR